VTTALQDDPIARVTSQLTRSVGERKFALWFDRSAQFDYQPDEQTLRVAVPNQFVANWIEQHFRQALGEAVEHQLGAGVTLRLEVDPAPFAQRHSPRTSAGEASAVGPATSSSDSGERASRACAARAGSAVAGRETASGPGSSAPMRHQLDDFIVGPSNQLAYAAAHRLASDEATAGQPLFLHGGCGLGKTHLLQGLCRRLQLNDPQARVLYTTGERFTNEYITAVRSNRLDAFRQRMRKLDLLAVDDVHFLANKQATQQEFLHSFNEIELGGARVALASDSHPKLIEQFSEALVNRCVHGLVVPINEPDDETRRRLVHELAARRGLHLQRGAVEMLACQSTGSVREIEGTLTKLHAMVTLGRGVSDAREPIGRAMIDQLLGADGAAGPRRPVEFARLRDTVAEEAGVSAGQLMGSSRQKRVVLARAVLVHLARELTSMSFPEIARAMGRSNHSTIITAAKRLQGQMERGERVTLPGSPEPIAVTALVTRIKRAIRRSG